MSPAPRPAPRDTRPNRKAPDPRSARSGAAAKRALRGESVSHDPLLAFSRTNYLLMGAGAAMAALGFLVLNSGDISFAPLMIVVGYCGLVPAGILYRKREAPRQAPGSGGAVRTGE